MQKGHFALLLLVGLVNGVIASSMSNFAFEVFIDRSLGGSLVLIFVFFLSFALSWITSRFVEDASGIQKARVIFVGISIASLVLSVFNLALFARRGQFGSWVIVTYEGPPYIGIMGVPFPMIIWSLFLGSFFIALERILKVWEESQTA